MPAVFNPNQWMNSPTWMGAAPLPATSMGGGARHPLAGAHPLGLAARPSPRGGASGVSAVADGTPGPLFDLAFKKQWQGALAAHQEAFGGGGGGGGGGGRGPAGGGGGTPTVMGPSRPPKKIMGYSKDQPNQPEAFAGVDENYALQDRSNPAFATPGMDNPMSAGEMASYWRGRGFQSSFGGEGVQGVPGFANGGFPVPGQPAIVGENGPEVIVPQVPTMVIPNHELQPGAGWAAGAMKPMDWIPSPMRAPEPMQAAPAMPSGNELVPMPGWASGAMLPAPTQTGTVAQMQPLPTMNLAAPPPRGMPTFQDLIRATPTKRQIAGIPEGVDPRAFKEFMKTPQGMGFILQGQREDARFNRTLTAEDQRYQRDRADAQEDKEAQEQADASRWDSVAEAMTQGGQLLTPADIAVIKSTKGAKAKQAVVDTLAKLRVQEQDDKRREAQQAGNNVTGIDLLPAPDGSGFVPVARTQAGGAHMAGGFMPTPQAAPLPVLTQLPTGEYVYMNPKTGAIVNELGQYEAAPGPWARPRLSKVQAPASTKAPTVREIRKPGAPGQPDQIDYQQWYPDKGWGPMQQMPVGASGGKPSAFLGKFGQ